MWGFPHLENRISAVQYPLLSHFNQQKKSPGYSLTFCPLNAGLEVAVVEPDGFHSFPAFSCASGAESGTVRTRDKGNPAYRTAACGANTILERRFQSWVIWQYRIPKPFAVQGAGVPLRADVALGVIKEQTGSAVIVAAPLSDKGAYLAQLRAGEPQRLTHCQTPA